jgi:hypothetical protein
MFLINFSKLTYSFLTVHISVLTLKLSRLKKPCNLFVWGLVTSRIFFVCFASDRRQYTLHSIIETALGLVGSGGGGSGEGEGGGGRSGAPFVILIQEF